MLPCPAGPRCGRAHRLSRRNNTTAWSGRPSSWTLLTSSPSISAGVCAGC